MNLYLTADQIGTPTGGGAVTFHESEALKELGPCEVWGREQLGTPEGPEPWGWDARAFYKFIDNKYKLAHVYAGTFSATVAWLRKNGCKVVYTAAAHDVAASRKAHEDLGVPFDYPHLNDPALWQRYVQGYLDADVLVCPSQHSAAVMRGFGARQRIEVIPHGVDLPPKCPRCHLVANSGAISSGRPADWPCTVCNGTGLAPVAPLPPRYTVGYLGAIGPDKGLRYLLEAWERLNYDDAVLRLAGAQSGSPFVVDMIRYFCPRSKGGIELCGWQEDVSEFYNSLSLYVQPSVTEGFGIEVLEAMAHGRPVLCSTGAGAADLVPEWYRFPAGNVAVLAAKINDVKVRGLLVGLGYPRWECIAADHTWDKIRQRYQRLWKELLA